MGEKGDRQTELSDYSAGLLLKHLSEIGNLSTKKMFGGIGVFHSGTMFGMVNSNGDVYFKADPKGIIDVGSSEKHPKMSYYTVGDSDVHSHMWKAWALASIEQAEAK